MATYSKNQPIQFTAPDVPCSTFDERCYKQFFFESDTIAFQNLITDGISGNICKNGDFSQANTTNTVNFWDLGIGQGAFSINTTNHNVESFGGSDTYLTKNLPMFVGRTYKVTFTLAGGNGIGTITPVVRGAIIESSGLPRSKPGTYIQYLTSLETGNFALKGESYGGTIDNIIIEELPGEWSARFLKTDNSVVAAFDNNFESANPLIGLVTTHNITGTEIKNYNIDSGTALPLPSCLRIKPYYISENRIQDPGFSQLFTNDDPTNTANHHKWIQQFGSNWTINNGVASCAGFTNANPPQQMVQYMVFNLTGTKAYKVGITVTAISNCQLYLNIDGYGITSLITTPGYYEYTVQVTPNPLFNIYGIIQVIANATSSSAGSVTVDNIFARELNIDDTAISQEFALLQDSDPKFNCTNYITYSCEDNAFGLFFPGHPFIPGFRVESEIKNPSWDEDVEDYRDSKGKWYTIYGASTTRHELCFSQLPEWMHNIVRIARIADKFKVAGKYYKPVKGGYEPEWKDFHKLANSRFQIVDQTEFNVNTY